MKPKSISIILLFIVSTMLIGIFSACDGIEDDPAVQYTVNITDEEPKVYTTTEETTNGNTAELSEPEYDLISEIFKDSKIFSFAPDMGEEEIYNELLKGGWVIESTGESDFVAGGELWEEFFEKSSRSEPCSVLLAYYSKDLYATGYSKDHIELKEIIFDGELYHYAQLNSLTDTVEYSGTYKYLIKDFYELYRMYRGSEIGQGLVKAYFLSNDSTWTYRERSHIELCAISHYPRNYYQDCMTISVQFELYDNSVTVPTGQYPVFIDSPEIWHSELFD